MKNIIYKQGDLFFKENYLKDGLKVAGSRSSLYTIIAAALMSIVNIVAFAQITDISNLMHQPEYLCKSSPASLNFDVICEKKFVCDPVTKKDIDYIFNPKKFRRSLITDYDIYCYNAKISSFGMTYFFGGLIGLFIAPELKYRVGYLGVILYSSIVTVFCNLFILLITNYWLGITVYFIGMISRTMIHQPAFQYLVEMGNDKTRALSVSILRCGIPLSGLFVNLMELITGDYRGQILANTVLFIISIILVKILLVESCSHDFGAGKYSDILQNFAYVAKVNMSQYEYRKWLIEIDQESKNFVDNDECFISENTVSSKSHNELITYTNIWFFKNMSSILIYFTIFSTTSQFIFIFLLYEITKLPNFYISSSICYVIDLLGTFFGQWMMETEYFKRRLSSVILNLLAGLAFILTGFVVLYYNFHQLIYLNRFLNSALQMVVYLTLIEILPKVLAPHANSIIRMLSRLLNVSTPLLMIEHPVICYFLIASLDIILALLVYLFDIKETKDVPMEEFPEEFKDPDFMKNLKEKQS